jgi:hypothetical protein
MFLTNVVEKIKTHIICSVTFLKYKNFAVFEIMRKNTVQPDRLQMAIWRMPIACWIHLATNTHSVYVLLIAFPLHQWLHDRAIISFTISAEGDHHQGGSYRDTKDIFLCAGHQIRPRRRV